MERGAWWAIVYGVTKESMGRDPAQQLTKTTTKPQLMSFLIGVLGQKLKYAKRGH